MYASDSIRNISAFALGGRSVNPQMKTYLMHVGSWFTPRNERVARPRLVEQHGVDLVNRDSDSTTLVALADSYRRKKKF